MTRVPRLVGTRRLPDRSPFTVSFQMVAAVAPCAKKARHAISVNERRPDTAPSDPCRAVQQFGCQAPDALRPYGTAGAGSEWKLVSTAGANRFHTRRSAVAARLRQRLLDRAHLDRAEPRRRPARRHLHRVVEVLRLDQEEAAELLLRLGVGAVEHGGRAVPHADRRGLARAPERVREDQPAALLEDADIGQCLLAEGLPLGL